MADFLRLLIELVRDFARSRATLEPENILLREQLAVLRRKLPRRMQFTCWDRFIFADLYLRSPRVVDALHIVRSETVIR